MATENDSGQDPSENKKDGGQGGGRNRRWRRRGNPNNQSGARPSRPEDARNQGGQQGKPAVNNPPKDPNPRPQGGNQQGSPQGNNSQRRGQQRRKSSRGNGGQRSGQPGAGAPQQDQNTAGQQQNNQNQQTGQRDGQQNPTSRRQDRRRQDSRRNRNPQNSAVGQEAGQERGPQNQNQTQRQGQRPGQPRDAQAKPTNTPQGRRIPRQNAPGASAQRRRPNSGGERGQSAYRQGQQFASSTPLKARGGIKARSSEGGEFGKNWWAKRWLLAMERLMDGARLQRGRRYARMGQVLSMNDFNGEVVAKVQGSRPAPYKVTIGVSPLSDEQWDQVLDVLAGRAIFTAQLLAGEMPPTIEEAFSAAGVSLFPTRGGDLHTECSCPDWANPCKHIAATQYILADRFDEDPFLLFRMRGRTQEMILQALRLRRTGSETVVEEEPVEEAPPPALEADIAHFWEMGPGLEDYSVNVQQPVIPLPLFKRLGEPDVARGHSLEETLGPALDVISQTALFLAFTDTSREPPENGDSA